MLYSGTTVGYQSIVHQMLTKSSEWVEAEHFEITHVMPTYINADGTEVSSWPLYRPLEWLVDKQKSDSKTYALNYENMPMAAGDLSWWTPDLLRIQTVPADKVSYRVLSIDPGISKKASADPTGVSVVSLARTLRLVSVDEVFEVKAKAQELKRIVLKLIEKYPDIRLIIWEATQGGENLAYATLGDPTPVPIHFTHPHEAKVDRADMLLTRYSRGQVVHAKSFPAFDRELLSFPDTVRSPNQTDSVGQAVEWLAKPENMQTTRGRTGPSLQVIRG